jgi:KaiC/GvpD/RAD55 family RecA-like ATPase
MATTDGVLERIRLGRLGIHDYAALTQLASTAQPDLVEGLFSERSVNILVGDSNLGKTPLAMTLAIAVASGFPFLGRKVSHGKVLYCDSETPLAEMLRMLKSISGTMGYVEPPADFFAHSLNAPENENDAETLKLDVIDRAREMKPQLVIVDPLRSFWPQAQKDAESATYLINRFRELSKEVGCATLLLHHRRKHSFEGAASLEEDPHGWLQEAAGSHALINHTDTRLGVEPVSGPGNAELVVSGFVRSKGRISPLHLAREYDPDSGEPVGYQALLGLGLLPVSYQEAFIKLSENFRHADAHKAMGATSGSNTQAFLDRCVTLGLVKRAGKQYVKTME